MSVEVRETALMLFLQSKDPALYGKAIELRDVVQNWLAYIPQTFPHYTRHTVLHSEAVILQMSKVLFQNDDPNQPVLKLSAMEAYILCPAAYLHDAGMIVSDQEKARILQSESWHEWISEGNPGAKRWMEIETFRTGAAPADSALRNFLANVQLRFLLAEFVRRTHHWRAQTLLRESQDQLGRFAFDDPILLGTIGAVCTAHGLDQQELDDRDRYPERRDIRGQQVNVRFLAIVLRLGDLLDMSTDRACPLLLNAACPLPAESLAHWTQYQRLTHFLVSPDSIQITALCKDQEEHRTIKDWCSWLVKEASNGTILMARSARHGGWQAPSATMGSLEPTIRIEPAPEASYIPSNWRFELDHELVFRRLIEDLYTEPLSFVRELIQNALDATRCELYLSLAAEGIPAPEFPTQVPEELRQQYVVRLSLEARKLRNLLSGENEERQVLVIEDPGIGMDRDIIEHYLLQVGRSYYTTVDFQKNFRFVPMSRFGLGFLSVFGASDHVTIETYKPKSNSGSLRLVLTGPRNYILLEKGSRRKSGTRIEVRLREPLKPQVLTEAVSSWCRRVEFPIIVEETGVEKTIRAERNEQFIYEMPDIMREGARFVVRPFDIQKHGLEGELYIFTRLDRQGESWDAWSDARYKYPESDPRATPPAFPDSITCIHGISIGERSEHGPYSQRLDFRGGDIPVPGLSRERARIQRGTRVEDDPRVASRWAEILNEHLANSERAKSAEGWKYKQVLVDFFPTAAFWASLPRTIPVHSHNELRLVSLDELQQIPLVATITGPQDGTPFPVIRRDRESVPNPQWGEHVGAIFADELEVISSAHREEIFRARAVDSVYWLPTQHLVIRWRKMEVGDGAFGGPSYRLSFLAELPSSFTVAFNIHSVSRSSLASVLFNSSNPFVRWLISVKEASKEGAFGIVPKTYETLHEKFQESCQYSFSLKKLIEYIEKWQRMPELPGHLHPPKSDLTPAMFARVPDPEKLPT